MPLQIEMYDDKKKKTQSFEVQVIGQEEDFLVGDFLAVYGRDHDDVLEELDKEIVRAIEVLEAHINDLKLMRHDLAAHVVPKYPDQEIDKRPYSEIIQDL